MSSISARPPRELSMNLLRLQYWYDRRTEAERLLVGLAVISFLGATWLYLLGLGSWVLVNRGPEVASISTSPALQVLPQDDSSVSLGESLHAASAPTATPLVDANPDLIQPPDVPEVPIIPAQSRVAAPVAPLKPRVVATTPTPAPPRPVATSAPLSTRPPVIVNTPQSTPARGSIPPGSTVNGAAATSTPAPARTSAPAPTSTPARQPTATSAPILPPARGTTTPTPTRR